MLVEPMLGVTFTPTMVRASDKINVIPSHAELKVDCRVPPELGEDYARMRIEEALGGEAYELELRRARGGQPLAARHAADGPHPRLPGRGGSGLGGRAARCCPASPTRAGAATAFPDCVAYGFCPQRKMDIFEATPLIHGADERIPVEDLGLAARFYAGLAPKVLG